MRLVKIHMVEQEKKLQVQKKAGKLVHLDPLQRYLNDIGKFNLLTPDEEHRLAVEFQKTGDPRLA